MGAVRRGGASRRTNNRSLAVGSCEENRRVRIGLDHGMTVEDLTDLDLSYTPPLGSPWDAVQVAAQEWVRSARERKLT